MSNARAIIEAESPKKALRSAERSIEQEMLFKDVPVGAVYFNPFPNGVTGTIEKKLPGWDRLGGYGHAAWIGRINSNGEREPLQSGTPINKDGGCRCFPVPKVRFAEAENPKKAFRAMRGEGGLEQWVDQNFIRQGSRFAWMLPFVCAPAYQGLSGRFWIYMVHGAVFGPWEFSCVLMGEGQLYSRTKMELYPVEPLQREIRAILSTTINQVRRAASNPQGGDAADPFAYRDLRRWLERQMGQEMRRAERQYQELENKHPGYWAI